MLISEHRMGLLHELMEEIEYKFKDVELLNLAFIHRSYINENKNIDSSNERLEFLGDVVIGFVVSVELFTQFKNDEGYLTKLRSKIVCEESFAYGAKKLNLGKYLLLGKGEDYFGGRDRNSILADTFESFFGALFLDGGIDLVKQILKKHFLDTIMLQIKNDIFIKDYKSYLQEYFHKNSSTKIRYLVVRESGPDHDKVFDICVMVDDNAIGYGSGKNKKQAEQNAAKDALNKLGAINE